MSKVFKVIRNISGIGLGFIFGAMILQVFFRHILKAPLYWSEEFGRFVFIYATWLGAYCALADDRMLTVDILSDYLPIYVRKAISWISYLLALGFFGVLGYQGVKFVIRSIGVKSSAMGLPMSCLYIIIPIASGLMMAEMLINYRKHLLLEPIKNPNQ